MKKDKLRNKGMKNFKIFLGILIAIIFILGADFLITKYIINREDDRELSYSDNVLRIKYLIMDEENTPEQLSLDDAAFNYQDYILSFTQGYVYLEDDGEYLTAELINQNDLLISNITDYAFALNDTEGNSINDAIYDIDENIVKIPKSYYEESDTSTPVQMEIVIRTTKEKLNNLVINKNGEEIIVDGLDTTISFSAMDYKEGKYLTKDDITIYVNNSFEVSEDYFEFDSTSGTITMDIFPTLVQDIEVKVKRKSIIEKMINITNVYADISDISDETYDSMESSGTLTTKLSSDDYSEGDSWTASIRTYYLYGDGKCYSGYPGSSGGYVSCSSEVRSVFSESSTIIYDTYGNEHEYDANDTTDEGGTYSDFILDMLDTGNSNIKFSVDDDSQYLRLLCAHIGTTTFPPQYGSYTITIAKLTDDYVVFMIIATNTTTANYGGGQYPVGLIKYEWESTNTYKGRIKVKKEVINKNGKVQNNAKFKVSLYEGNSCSGDAIATKSITSKQLATFNVSLEEDDATDGKWYSLKETSYNCTNYDCDTSCKKVFLMDVVADDEHRTDDALEELGITEDDYPLKYAQLKAQDSDGVWLLQTKTLSDSTYRIVNQYYARTTSNGGGGKFTNIYKYYCLKVKKQDAESSCALSGVTFALTNGSSTYTLTTGTDGIATIEYLTSSSSWKLSETTSDNTLLTCGSNNYYYWNENSSSESVTVTEMTYNSSSGTYTCPSSALTKTAEDHKRYTYIIVRKVDGATNTALSGAQFTATCGSNTYKSTTTGSDGYAVIFTSTESTSTKCTIEETTTPEGYATAKETEAYPKQLPSDTKGKSESEAKAWLEENYSSLTSSASNYTTVKDYVLVMNWYKENEDGNSIKTGAKFTVKDSSGNTIKASGKQSIEDANGTTKSCYIYSSSGSITEFESDSNGEVCIAKLPGDTGDKYTITETEPAKYHTFGSSTTLQIEASTVFSSKSSSNKFINYPTKIVFTKNVSNESDYSNNKITFIENGSERTVSYNELTTEELMLIEFNVYDSSGNKLSFIKTAEGVYEYAANDEDGVSGTKVTALYLNSSRQITIYHLPVGTYYIKEANVGICGEESTDTCIGYYYPDYGEDPGQYFKVTNEYTTYTKGISVSLTNTRTELTFTKKDFYSYYDTDDENVDFETEEERNEFDHIEFKLKDSTGYLTLVKVRDVGTCSDDDKDTSYSEYRYVLSADAVLDTNGKVEGTSLYTYCGHMKITNLCRGKEYTVEEVSVPDDSVFVKENTSSTPTTSSYTIPCKDTTDTTKITEESTTTLISNKPTRVKFEKRDSKYGYLIDDETTTFNVYRCDSSVDECTPENGTLVKFSERGTINGDEEDDGVEVYKRVSDSDIEKGATYVTDLHPYKGVLVLRYLQSGYKYVLVETVSPLTYTLPQGSDAYTQFTVTSETVDVEEIDVPNKPTSILIRKYSDTGELLEGAAFKVYESTNEGSMCDSNLSAMNQPKKLLTLKTIRDGVYENRPVKDTDTVVTCTDTEDSKCSDISTASSTQLTYSTYLGTWADFAESENQDGERIELQEGEALIQYLDYGKCYIIEEVKAPTGYSLPENEEDRYTMVTIEANTDYVADTEKTLVNKPTSFTFYKYDEYNNLLDGAEYKLQKLDDNKKYQDVTVTQEEENGLLLYKVDENSTNTTITTKNGSATVYYLEPGQYRIVETKAAEGKELPKNPNVATFYVDDEGNVYGNSIIVNKGKTETVEVKSSASAELIVVIQTGQTVIKYGLIISVIIFAIAGLMLLRNKKSK